MEVFWRDEDEGFIAIAPCASLSGFTRSLHARPGRKTLTDLVETIMDGWLFRQASR